MRYRHAMVLLLASLPVCVILRIIQMVFAIDEGTGFVKQQYSTIALLISVIICAAIASVSLLTAITDIKRKESEGPQLALAVSSLLVGGMLIYRAVSSVSTFIKATTWYDSLLLILTIVSAFVFLAYGLKNISDFKMPMIMFVVPVFYFIVKLITVFISTSSLALVTENVFLIFTSSAVLWFMFEFSNYENGIGDKDKKSKKIFASGVASIMFCTVMSVPKFVFAIISKKAMSGADVSATLLDIAMAIFILAYVMCKFGEVQKDIKAPSKHSA